VQKEGNKHFLRDIHSCAPSIVVYRINIPLCGISSGQ